MRNFEEKLRKTSKQKSTIGIIFLVFAILFLIIGFANSDTQVSDDDKIAFNPMQSQSERVSLEVYYLFGPFAEYSEGNVVISELYAAYATDGLWYLVQIGPNSSIPKLGIDVTEDNIGNLQPIEISGRSTFLTNELAEFLIEFWNELYQEELYTTSNYADYFGMYYLDTTYNYDNSNATVFYVLAGIFAVIAIIGFAGTAKENKKRKQKVEELKNSQNYYEILNDYEGDSLTEMKKYHVAIGEKYLFDFSNGMNIITLQDITNAYRSNMIDGVYQLYRYIAIETKNNEKYYVAKTPLKSKQPIEYDELLEKLKSNIRQGGF